MRLFPDEWIYNGFRGAVTNFRRLLATGGSRESREYREFERSIDDAMTDYQINTNQRQPMHVKTRNVNTAFHDLVLGIHSGTIPTHVCASRYGEVIMVEEPVMVTYERPKQHVLFNPARDANPFFHLYESLWMLAGRNDVAPLAYYNARMPEFSDDGKTFNGAYGYRWRRAEHYEWSSSEDVYRSENVDQLSVILNHLNRKGESRRAVMSMWNVEDDLLKIDTSKDVCCNLAATFQLEQGVCPRCKGKGEIYYQDSESDPCPKCNGKPHDQPQFLNMTVFNRSNDLVWGMLGANAVHFSILQEYMATALGVEVGVYNQVTTNLHAYTNTWEPDKWLACEQGESQSLRYYLEDTLVPLVKNPTTFDRELPDFVEEYSEAKCLRNTHWIEPFLQETAAPLLTAFRYHKAKDYGKALNWCTRIYADDWRRAATYWIKRRAERVRSK